MPSASAAEEKSPLSIFIESEADGAALTSRELVAAAVATARLASELVDNEAFAEKPAGALSVILPSETVADGDKLRAVIGQTK